MSIVELAKITIYKNKDDSIRQISVRFYYDQNEKYKRFVEFYCIGNKRQPNVIHYSSRFFDYGYSDQKSKYFRIENSIEESIVERIKILITEQLDKYNFSQRQIFVEEIRNGLYSLKMRN